MYAPVWVTVPAGPFLMGSVPASVGQPFANESPRQQLALPAFSISRVPVTNAQYEKFVRATQHPAPGHWPCDQVPAGKAQHRLRMSIGAMRRHSVRGRAHACRAKRSGRRRHAARTAGCGRGAATHPTRRAATTTRPVARQRPCSRTRRRSVLIRAARAPTACWTWRATSGNGRIACTGRIRIVPGMAASRLPRRAGGCSAVDRSPAQAPAMSAVPCAV
jgi:Sulfatase-modifying factor enzyme 1